MGSTSTNHDVEDGPILPLSLPPPHRSSQRSVMTTERGITVLLRPGVQEEEGLSLFYIDESTAERLNIVSFCPILFVSSPFRGGGEDHFGCASFILRAVVRSSSYFTSSSSPPGVLIPPWAFYQLHYNQRGRNNCDRCRLLFIDGIPSSSSRHSKASSLVRAHRVPCSVLPVRTVWLTLIDQNSHRVDDHRDKCFSRRNHASWDDAFESGRDDSAKPSFNRRRPVNSADASAFPVCMLPNSFASLPTSSSSSSTTTLAGMIDGAG